MKFIIFTDESGSWNEKPKKENELYYVRCWVKVPEKKCRVKIIGRNKKSLFYDIDKIKDYPIKIFFTFSCLSEFYNQKFIIREEIKKEIGNVLVKLGEILKDYMKKIPGEVEDAINRILFLNVYERYAWQDAIDSGILDGVEKIYIHSPQFTKSEYEGLLQTVGFEKGKWVFVSGDKNEEVNLADTLSKLMRRVLSSNFSEDKQVSNLKELIKNNCIKTGRVIPGVDKVFFKYRLNTDKIIKNRFEKYLL